VADQRHLCRTVLERLAKAGVLDDLLVIGSWCLEGYRGYFERTSPLTTLRTRDIDFLVPRPRRPRHTADVPALLEDLGFVRDVQRAGYIRLVHPDLIVEFLVPEHGRGTDKPVPLPQLHLNAQALRFLDVLTEQTITATVEGVQVRMPHPAAFALHKLLMAPRRQGKTDKRAKDIEAAFAVLTALKEHGEDQAVKDAYDSLPPRWQAHLRRALSERPGMLEWVMP